MTRQPQSAPVLTTNEARQAKRTGLIWVLAISLLLALAVGFGIGVYWPGVFAG